MKHENSQFPVLSALLTGQSSQNALEPDLLDPKLHGQPRQAEAEDGQEGPEEGGGAVGEPPQDHGGRDSGGLIRRRRFSNQSRALEVILYSEK